MGSLKTVMLGKVNRVKKVNKLHLQCNILKLNEAASRVCNYFLLVLYLQYLRKVYRPNQTCPTDAIGLAQIDVLNLNMAFK